MARAVPTTRSLDREPPSMSSFVLTLADNGVSTTFELPTEGAVHIGRDPDCELVLADDSVSRRHAVIRCGPRPRISDAGSRNGTRVTGKRLGEGESAELRQGGVIELGSVIAFVHARGSPGADMLPQGGRGDATGDPTEGVIVHDPTMVELYSLLHVIAPSKLSVLVLGETGTGKEVYAARIHALSDRRDAPFLRLNCAALTESLLEAELFGFEKGAFTGAHAAKQGLFEAADHGTVFLDEVGEMSATTQAKLLRVLENGEVTRIGSVKSMRVDVRIVAATNRDLETLAQAGTFRSDLYFRLNGVSVTLPPLRKRPLDIVPLAKAFAHAHSAVFAEEAEKKLSSYRWPGNARELKNVVDRAALMARGGEIAPEHITFGSIAPPPSQRGRIVTLPPPPAPPSSAANVAFDSSGGLRGGFADVERERVLSAMEECGGNQSRAAKRLGIARSTLIRRLEEYGVVRPRKT